MSDDGEWIDGPTLDEWRARDEAKDARIAALLDALEAARSYIEGEEAIMGSKCATGHIIRAAIARAHVEVAEAYHCGGSVERFAPDVIGSKSAWPDMTPHKTGGYVRYSDYATLTAERDRLHALRHQASHDRDCFAAGETALTVRVTGLEETNAALRAANDMLLRTITGDENG